MVDDHRLISLLAAEEPPSGRYATTCSWWWRLTSAFAGHRRGALSRRLERLDPRISSAVRSTVRALPTHFEIVDLRLLVPAMGVLAQDHAVNQLAAEAVAAAAYVEAPIEVEINAPEVRDTAGGRGARRVLHRLITVLAGWESRCCLRSCWPLCAPRPTSGGRCHESYCEQVLCPLFTRSRTSRYSGPTTTPWPPSTLRN